MHSPETYVILYYDIFSIQLVQSRTSFTRGTLMIVRELIEQLSKYDSDAEVHISNVPWDGGDASWFETKVISFEPHTSDHCLLGMGQAVME